MVDDKGPAQPFLTEAQRAALDAALAAKQQATGDGSKGASQEHAPRVYRKHGVVHVKPLHGTAGDRRKSTTRNGEAKKKGAGGKYTWGAVLLESSAAPSALDKDDPNYDSDENAVIKEVPVNGSRQPDAVEGHDLAEDEYFEANYIDPVYRTNSRIVQAVSQLKNEIMLILKEYLESGDAEEAAACVAELQLPQYDYYIVKRAITLAMDRKEREREAVSALLSSLYGQHITPQQMQKGFVSVLEDFDELVLDVPDAVEVMSLFVCRAIVDEVLPPSFITRILPPAGSPLEALKESCQAHMKAPHCWERMSRCWGAESKLTLQEARDRIKAMLREYVTGGDYVEVERQLRSLDAPYFHHEVVKQGLLMAAEDMPHAKDLVVSLLRRTTASNEISKGQVYKGFQRLEDQLGDLSLDIPGLEEAFHRVRDECVAQGVIDAADISLLDASSDRHRSIDGERSSTSSSSNSVRTVPAFKAATARMLHEYFGSADSAEECTEAGMMHLFVKQAFVMALERTDRERELLSRLFAALVPDAVALHALETGFVRLLAACDDIVLDVPDAAHLLTLFLARLVVDEVVAPAFLTHALAHVRSGSLAVVVIGNAGRLLSARHGAERVLQCWEGGQQSASQLAETFRVLVKEHVANPDAAETLRSIRALHASYYHHELVRQIVLAAFEGPATASRLIQLLKFLNTSGAVTDTQLNKGLKRVDSGIQDYELDCPQARDILQRFLAACGSDGQLLQPEP